MIVLDSVSKSFKEQVALNKISATFEKGKIYGIIGRNGSGKTVLFKCICGFMNYDAGTITVNKQIIGKDIDIPDNVGIIIENPGFLPNYSGFKNLCLLACINNKISKEKIKVTIKKVGLDPDSKKHVSKYSLGMRQRLGIAQAIMEDPEILILDEPMNGLDNSGVKDIRNIIKGLREEGKTILLASHNSEDIKELCDTVYEMDAGVITKVR